MSQVYRVNSEDVMHETIDGEVVIVNLDSGAYYAIEGSGQYIWDRLSNEGASQEQLLEALGADDQTLAEAVKQFFAELIGEKLLIPDTGADEITGGKLNPPETIEAPKLNKYTDILSTFL